MDRWEVLRIKKTSSSLSRLLAAVAMRLGTMLKRVHIHTLAPGCQVYINLASRRPVRYEVLWIGKDSLECVTKGGRVRRFHLSEVWLDISNLS